MKDMRAVRANEKLKRSSTIIGNGGLALLIAGFSHLYAAGVDIPGATWTLIASALIWIGVQINELLDPEDG